MPAHWCHFSWSFITSSVAYSRIYLISVNTFWKYAAVKQTLPDTKQSSLRKDHVLGREDTLMLFLNV